MQWGGLVIHVLWLKSPISWNISPWPPSWRPLLCDYAARSRPPSALPSPPRPSLPARNKKGKWSLNVVIRIEASVSRWHLKPKCYDESWSLNAIARVEAWMLRWELKPPRHDEKWILHGVILIKAYQVHVTMIRKALKVMIISEASMLLGKLTPKMLRWESKPPCHDEKWSLNVMMKTKAYQRFRCHHDKERLNVIEASIFSWELKPKYEDANWSLGRFLLNDGAS